MRILENMKRPSVIVKSYTAQESDLLSQALQAWRIATGQSTNFNFLSWFLKALFWRRRGANLCDLFVFLDSKGQMEMLKPLFAKAGELSGKYNLDQEQRQNMTMNSFFCIKLHLVVRYVSASHFSIFHTTGSISW